MTLKKALVISLLVLAACKKSGEAEVVASTDSDQQAAGDVGPFTVNFDGSAQTFAHSVKGVPKQGEGKVEYYITVNEKSKVTLVSTEIKVVGCPASQVSYQTFWLPDATKAEGTLVMNGLSFQPTPGLKGSLMHVMHGLDGCSEVQLATSLKREKILKPNPTFPVGQACEGSSASSPCTVQVYCREQDPLSTYHEFEVWSYSWGRQVNHYMKSSDGKRSLMSSSSVTVNAGATSTSYTGSSASLTYDNATGMGRFSERMAGQTFSYDTDCTYQQ